MIEFREDPAFIEEATQPPLIVVAARLRNRHHAIGGTAGRAQDRQVFLDRDQLIEVGVVRQVGDAEPALPEDGANLIPEKLEAGGSGQCLH